MCLRKPLVAKIDQSHSSSPEDTPEDTVGLLAATHRAHREDLSDQIKSFHVSGNLCSQLITRLQTIVSLDPEKNRQNVGPYLYPNCLTL